MKWISFITAFGISLLFSKMAVLAAEAPLIIPPGEGIDLSDLGRSASISQVYRTADGNLVLYVYFKDKAGVGRSDYYDTRSRKLLFPDREIELANYHGPALEDRLRPSGLQRVKTRVMEVEAPVGHGVEGAYEGGSVCHEAYSSPWTVWGAGEEVRFVVLARRGKPERRDDLCDGDRPYLVHYDDLAGNLFGADMRGFFATVDGALIWFDWRGNSQFFKMHRDFVRVPYDKRLDCRDTSRQAGKCHLARESYIDSLRGS